ncbi:hypothetical protein ACMFMF_004718 [Clarireedia jacksonii]
MVLHDLFCDTIVTYIYLRACVIRLSNISALNNSLLLTGSLIPETRFPFLDTVYRSLADRRSHNGCSSNHAPRKHQKTPSKKFGPRKWRLDDTSIDQSYAKFIIDLTGRDEVAFRATHHYNGQDLSKNQRKGHSIVHARQVECGDGYRSPTTLEYFKDSSFSVPTLDFRIEVLDTSEPHDFFESFDEVGLPTNQTYFCMLRLL